LKNAVVLDRWNDDNLSERGWGLKVTLVLFMNMDFPKIIKNP